MKEEDITKKQDTEFWATNAEQGGWTVTSTDEGSQKMKIEESSEEFDICLLYTSPSPRD